MNSRVHCRTNWVPVLISLLVALPLAAEESAPPVSPPGPRIGLVLGGGGAKGAAHIGVLRVLDEMHIPISCVVGTSMGALVGGTFASGMPPAEIEREVLAINWSKTVGSEGARDQKPINRKLAGITYTNSLDLGIKGGRLQGGGGLLKSQNIEDVIRGLVTNARSTKDFDDLPIPFRAVATDMLAGDMVVLEDGDLSVAMRASMSVPGAFSPVLMEGMVLADGGMMRNLPVDIARELCADVVIAVSLESPAPKPENLTTTLDLASRSLDVMIEANQKAQVATLTDVDVSIVVPMGDIGSASFERVPDAVPLGRAAALAQVAELRRYAVPEDQYLAWRQSLQRERGSPLLLADVKVTGLKRVSPDYVRTQLEIVAPGREVTTAQIVDDTARIYALGDFERVEYVLSGPQDATKLEIRAVEKSWGPRFVRFDLGFTASGVGNLEAVIRADYDRTWLNQRGGEWRNAIQFGQQSLLQTSLYQPLDVPQRFFIEPLIRFENELEDIYDNGDRVATYVLRQLYGQLDAGLNLGTRAQIRAGLRSGWLAAQRDTGATVLPNLDRQVDSSAQLRVVYDTRNDVSLPTRGTFLNARLVSAGAWLGGQESYGLAEGVLSKSYPFRGDALTLLVGGGKRLNGQLPPTQEFQLGGIRTFPGLQYGELRGDSYWVAGTRYNWKIADIQSLFGQAIYAGLRLQAGRMGAPIDDGDYGAVYGISGNLGANTPLGPIILSLGYVDNDSWALQLAIGRPIAEGSILDEVR